MTKKEGLWNSTKEVAGDTWDKTKDISGHIWAKTKETADDVKEFIVGEEEEHFHSKSEYENNHPHHSEKHCSHNKMN